MITPNSGRFCYSWLFIMTDPLRRIFTDYVIDSADPTGMEFHGQIVASPFILLGCSSAIPLQ
jgi:hypothetical protein